MANTKSLSMKDRKQSKRKSRTELKKLFGGLNRKQRRSLREEKQGLKQFLASLKPEAAAE